ncbi:hypothetical protein [Ammoniphilus sp. CFH 90114]|uniref:hypothetical protein n=1 Tax=Ammoniphilus sp. CFH 90114 TaxID=2493665 RepID=UPI00100F12BD|nr:hypothetical protein [Ammoniphilus sp. CFH 90114]RXT05799.1 hypothetical protein EIZ39_16990 [Ammoniphilus sp. CFH 90114]
MLTATIQFKPTYQIEGALLVNGFKNSKESYVLETKQRKELVRAEVRTDEVLFTFPGNLGMGEYETVHEALKNVLEASGGSIDDSNSLLGYLPNGEGAYIIHQFRAWTTFLLTAKHHSMKGQKVQVLDQAGRVMGEGLLMDYELEESHSFSVSKCTLVTTFGEQSYTGKHLKIEPTGSW